MLVPRTICPTLPLMDKPQFFFGARAELFGSEFLFLSQSRAFWLWIFIFGAGAKLFVSKFLFSEQEPSFLALNFFGGARAEHLVLNFY